MKKPKRSAVARPMKAMSVRELPPVASIPPVPEDQKPLDGAAKQALLKVPSDQRAEIDQALEQIWARRADLAKDLGTLAPDTERAKVLRERLTKAREVNRKAQALATYTGDQEALANHDVMAFINDVGADIEHMAQKMPQIAERYNKVLAVLTQRREAIAAGIARSKASATEPTTG